MKLRERLQSLPALYRAARRARLFLGQAIPPRYFPEVKGRIHANDVMLLGAAPVDYRRVGDEAIAAIERALEAARRDETTVHHILDFGSGFGRVTRVLVERFGAERIWVYDVDESGPRFCASEFGVRPISIQLEGAHPSGCYDVVWAGSVFSHLDSALTRRIIDAVVRVSAPAGIVVVTTLGDASIRRLPDGLYGPHVTARANAIRTALDSKGFAFVPYPYSVDGSLGTTWMTRETVDRFFVATGRLKRIGFWPAAWDSHQDVHAFERTALS